MMCICMTRVVRCEVGGGSGHTAGARAADATAAVNSSLSQEGGLMD